MLFVYEALSLMLLKTEDQKTYASLIADKFVNSVTESNSETDPTSESDSTDPMDESQVQSMAGLHILLRHMSSDSTELRDAALGLTAKLMRADSSVAVQILKFNLLSNLILAVLREDPSTGDAICEILSAATECPHRMTLLTLS